MCICAVDARMFENSNDDNRSPSSWVRPLLDRVRHVSGHTLAFGSSSQNHRPLFSATPCASSSDFRADRSEAEVLRLATSHNLVPVRDPRRRGDPDPVGRGCPTRPSRSR